jgi:cysteinyl-tRNA synthetase
MESLIVAIDATHEKFTDEMDDDFNTAGALAALFELIRQGNTFLDTLGSSEPDPAERRALQQTIDCLVELFGVLGVVLTPQEVSSDAEAEALLHARSAARAAKDWERADMLRDRLVALGYLIEDTAQGPRLVKNTQA